MREITERGSSELKLMHICSCDNVLPVSIMLLIMYFFKEPGYVLLQKMLAFC